MSFDIREYLADRFRNDAETLRTRAAAMLANAPAGRDRSGGQSPAGPNAALSRTMADACDDVATLAEALPEDASLPTMLAALDALVPELRMRADAPALAATPAVRAVYIGAITRVQEVIAAERRAMDGESESPRELPA